MNTPVVWSSSEGRSVIKYEEECRWLTVALSLLSVHETVSSCLERRFFSNVRGTLKHRCAGFTERCYEGLLITCPSVFNHHEMRILPFRISHFSFYREEFGFHTEPPSCISDGVNDVTALCLFVVRDHFSNERPQKQASNGDASCSKTAAGGG